MRIVVFGGTGSIGRLVVEQAIEQGLSGPGGGLFGPALAVDAVTDLDRLVARAGRDPGWGVAVVP